MISFRKKNSHSLSLVKELLVGNLFQDNEKLSIKARKFTCGERASFNPKGTARIEILYDTLVAAEDNDQIILYGLAESIDEVRIALTLFCETTWFDKEYLKKRKNTVRQKMDTSLIIDFDEESQDLSSVSFELTFNAPKNDQIIGQGSGYLRFEPN